jgi:mannosyltransferase
MILLRKDSSPYGAILLLILLASFLRLSTLGRESLWLDEAISYLTAQLPVSQIVNNTVQSSHPPLYYLLLNFWLKIVPDGDTAVKLLSVLWNLLLIPATYFFSQQMFGKRAVSLTAAALITISPFQILYSQELRMYTQLMFLVVAGTAAYWQARQKESTGWWLVAGGCFLLAIYTHLFAFLALAGIGLHALLEIRTKRRAFWATAAIIAVILIAFLPWLRLMLAEAEPALGSLRPLQQATTFNPLKPISAPVFLLFGMSSSFWFSGAILFIFFAYLIIFLLELRKLGWQQMPSGLKLTLLIIVCVLGLPLLIYVIRPFFLPERTLAAAAPFLTILLSWGITRRQTPLPYLTGLAALLMLIGTFSYLTGELVKPPYRAATTYITERTVASDSILHSSDGSYLPALRYAPQLTQGVLAGDPDPRKPEAVYEALGGQMWSLDEVAEQDGRLWLIVALEHSIAWQMAQVEAIAATRPLLEEKEIGGIRIFLYGRPK